VVVAQGFYFRDLGGVRRQGRTGDLRQRRADSEPVDFGVRAGCLASAGSTCTHSHTHEHEDKEGVVKFSMLTGRLSTNKRTGVDLVMT
jgi:hypothetical protein